MARALLLFLSCVGVCVLSVNGKALSLKSRIHCCNLGVNHSTSGQECKNFQSPTMGIEPGEETACRIIGDVCCKKQFKLLQCNLGKKDAKENTCSIEDGERKECCSACMMGIDIGNAGELCVDSIGLGSPYDKAFISCCEEIKATASTSSSTTSTTRATSSTAEVEKYSKPRNNGDSSNLLPGLSEENICEASEYCAQLCKTTEKGTYQCACFEGYVLMDDGVSCKPVKRALRAGGRCEINNPCDHDCIDTGTQIKCACREGYELAADKRTCKDIDECALNLHDCASNEECVNEEGTYDCYDPSLSPLDYDAQSQCPTGYRFNSEKLTCDDINECEFGIVCAHPKVCKNSIGSFTCEGEDEPACPPGFHYKASVATCADIDECITGQNNCNKESQVCLNTKGNYTCVDKASKHSCPPGFKKNIITGFCEDIDECMEDITACAANEKCVNEEGGHTCVPLERTSIGNDIVQPPVEILTTTPKPVKCPTGFRFVKEQNACDDIDECAETLELCDSTSTCVNTPGSYICQCKVGFQSDSLTGSCEDINECVLGANICGVGQRCDNTPGSYLCTRIYGCGTGYTLNHANGICEDDDECRLGTHNCNKLGPNFKCRNILGSYRCDIVRPLQTTRRTTPSTTTTSSTPSSTTSTTSTTTSTTTTTTTETPPRRQDYHPSYATSPRPYQPPYFPPPVFRQTPPPAATHPSPTPRPYTTYTRPTARTYPETPPIPLYQNTTPVNYYSSTQPTPPRMEPARPISYYPYPYPNQGTIIGQRKLCLPGYVMNSRGDCEDIDECLSNPCPSNRKCVNFNGRFECASPMQCKRGYELNDDGDQCVDVNECSRGTHKCHFSQICRNGEGYYTCECPPGHHLSRTSNICEDIDECRIYRPCGSNSECINTKGSYQCSCKDGFKKNDNLCLDIDECAESPTLCEHTCVNIWGSYRCACKRGFRLNLSDNRTCVDIDECDQHKNDRLCIGQCQNVPGSYRCVCPPGYKLGNDGRICLDIDECENNICGHENVCFNTRGSYKCYPINCPSSYLKDPDHKARCKRTCDPRDTWCLLKPDQYTYQFLSLASDLPVNGKIQLFQIKGPQWPQAIAEFSMKVADSRGVERVTEQYFQKVNYGVNSMTIYLVRSIKGPQELKLQVEMKLYDGQRLMGSTVIYIIIDVSQFSF